MMYEQDLSPSAEGSDESVAILLALNKRGGLSFESLRAQTKLPDAALRSALQGLAMRSRIKATSDAWSVK
jgi:hypothetical protein